MKRLLVAIVLIAVAGCATQVKRPKPVAPKAMKSFDDALQVAKQYEVPQYLPDYWEGLNLFTKEAKQECRVHRELCQKLFQKVRKSVLEAIELTYLVKERRQ